MAKRIRTQQDIKQQAVYFQEWYARPENASRRKEQAKRARKRSLERNRLFLKEYKAQQKCEICSESYPACLDFHHKDKTTKLGDISGLVTGMISLNKIKAEIEKCQVLCKNCHAKLHDKERGN